VFRFPGDLLREGDHATSVVDGEAANLSDKQSRVARRRRRLRSRFVQAVLLLVIYYLVPVHEETDLTDQLVRGALALAFFVGVVFWITREVVRQTSVNVSEVNQDRLFLLVVFGVILFAVADLALARIGPSEFVSLETKTDALYFSFTTLATVGFGDVHAQGQIARGLLIVQMVFNVVVLARAAQTLLASRDARRSKDEDE
jgi:voltage-gated potassium channel